MPAGVTNVVSVACGSFHTLVLLADGSVMSWGWNTHGQTTVPTGMIRAAAVSAGDRCSMALLVDGRISAWGSNTYGVTNVRDDHGRQVKARIDFADPARAVAPAALQAAGAEPLARYTLGS